MSDWTFHVPSNSPLFSVGVWDCLVIVVLQELIRLLVMVGLLGIYLAGGDAVCLRISNTGCLVGAGIMASIYWLVIMLVYFKGCFIYWDCIFYD